MIFKFIVGILVLFSLGCKKDSPPAPAAAPDNALLVFPAENEICTEGKVISPSESAIRFTWNPSNNTDSYELTVSNLLTGITTVHAATETALEISLLRNTPYSWYVLSKSKRTGTIAKSEVWKFYNAGPGTISYAPFPAEIVAPAMGQTVAANGGKVTLDWIGNDVDEDIITYDVYLGTNTSPVLLKSDQAESILIGVSVTSNTTYYWKVVTKDSQGNTSDSGLYQFKVS